MAWRESEYGQRTHHLHPIEVVTASSRDLNHKIEQATNKGAATLLVREFGRGVDFKSADDNGKKPGRIHVVQTFLSASLSEEIQIRGRTARQKNYGTYELVLLEEHLKSQLQESDFHMDEVAKREEGGEESVYKYLHDMRAIALDRSTRARDKKSQEALALHRETKRFQAALARVSFGKAHATDIRDVSKFVMAQNRITRTGCRIMCLSDATASMDAIWSAAKSSIKIMLERLSEVAGASKVDAFKWVAYRDYDMRNRKRSPLLEASPWSKDPATLVGFVNNIQCNGGGDFEEAVEHALKFAGDDPDPPTCVIVIADAPPHFEGKGQQLTRHAGVVLETDYKEECKKLEGKGIAVHTMYLPMRNGAPHEDTQRTFTEIAEMTNGTHRFLDPEKNEDDLLNAVCLVALGDIDATGELQKKYKVKYLAS